ncbi:MAG: DUF3536 domain-containing protein [Deltaproteobacteria bacterium]|jgi:alpha-amylase/alpha-mannosidase (GH57 family)|nr:DUF3536 domain-containing protein [Deltaproteobacteria bacterium]
MKGYICIHGHFYQPPRENPWLERIERQDSAYPHHDWNARVHAECYAPNAVSRTLNGEGRITSIVNNYEHISFNFGPTLLRWIEENSPDIYQKIIQADAISARQRGGHGNAIAQAYNHMIMPLANHRDKVTQVVWGISSFRRHFGRDPEGMWLPETAVDTETLEILHEHGIRFTILSPRQAKRIRPLNSPYWCDVAGGLIDSSMPYLIRLPGGGSINVFFYNGKIAHDVAFGGLLHSGETFARTLIAALTTDSERPPLVTVATDGETYGHHHRFTDMALASALEQIRKNTEVCLTNYGEYLSLYPPLYEVEIFENSSWSCMHGVERWRTDCGCRMGGQGEWNQKWRQTLRESLDWLRYELIRIYQGHAPTYLKDPWQARNDYIEVVMSRLEETKKAFFGKHAIVMLQGVERAQVLRLLEMQRNAMLMYTSCGWYFDEISGLEAVQVLSYAGRAIELAQTWAGASLEQQFMQRLSEAKSNIEGMGTGADIYPKFSLASKANLKEVAIHFAISSFFEDYQKKSTLGCYAIDLVEYEKQRHDSTVAAVGLLHTRSLITEEEATYVFAALQHELHDYHCAVKEWDTAEIEGESSNGGNISGVTYPKLAESIFTALKEAGPSHALKIIDKLLDKNRYTINNLFKDEQDELLDIILNREMQQVSVIFEEIFQKTSFLTALLEEYGHRIPSPLINAAEVTLKKKLVEALDNPRSTTETIRILLNELKRWHIVLDQDWLEQTLCARLEREMNVVKKQQETSNIKNMNGLLVMMYLFPVRLNLWQVQNIYFELLQTCYQAKKSLAKSGDSDAQKWLDEFLCLGDGLFMNVESLLEVLVPETKPKTGGSEKQPELIQLRNTA